MGSIASDPEFSYSNKEAKGDCIVYEGFSFGGNSGSPIFALPRGITNGSGALAPRQFYFVGINAGHFLEKGLQQRHAGLSYFYKSSVILDLIDNIE